MIEPDSARHQTEGRLLLVAAAVLWSVIGVAVKSPVLSAVPGPVFAGCRALTAGLFLLPFVRKSMIRWRWGLVPMVICFASMNVLFIMATQQTTAAAAIFLQNTASLWAVAYAAIFLREPIARGNLIALFFGIIGITWIVYNDWTGERFQGNAISVASGIAYAGIIITLRNLRAESPVWLIFLNYVVSGLMLLPAIFQGMSTLTPLQWILLAGIGPIQMGLPYLMFAKSLKWIPPQEAALILLLEPLLNPLWVWICWGETVSIPTLGGGGFILLGLGLRYTIFRDQLPVTVSSPDKTVITTSQKSEFQSKRQ